MIVLGIIGSLRAGSHNRTLLTAAGAALPAGAELRVFEGLAGIPPYCEDVPAGPEVQRLRAAIAAADAVLIATPEYNSSIPGLLKNALDWASRPFPHNCLRGKPAAVIGASTGLFGAVWAQAELRKVLTAIGARVLDEELPVGRAHEAFDDAGALTDPGLRATLAAMLDQWIAHLGAQPAGRAG